MNLRVALMLSAVCLAAGEAQADSTPVLKAGGYQFTASGDLCNDNASNFIANLNNRGAIYFAGPGKTGSALTTGYTQSSGNAQSNTTLYTLALPSAPVSGLSNWTGTYTGHAVLNTSTSGVPGTPKVTNMSGSITLNLIALSPTSFYGSFTIAPSSGNGCTLLIGGGAS